MKAVLQDKLWWHVFINNQQKKEEQTMKPYGKICILLTITLTAFLITPEFCPAQILCSYYIPPPSNLTGQQICNTGIKLTWNHPSPSSWHFRIERKTDTLLKEGTWAHLAEVPQSVTTYTDPGATDAVQKNHRHYRVQAWEPLNGCGSNYSNTTPGLILPPKSTPAAPTNFTAEGVCGGIQFTWADNSTNENGFIIKHQATWVDPPEPFHEIARVSNTTTYTFETYEGGYMYKVFAYNVCGESASSNPAGGSLVSPLNARAPSNLKATTISSTQINLTWDDNSNNENEFDIERATSFGGPFIWENITLSDISHYEDIWVNPNTTYYYRVHAWNICGFSANTNIAVASTSIPKPKAMPLVGDYYRKILDREPDGGGQEYWANEIVRITALGINVGEGFQAEGRFFFNSTEYLGMAKDNTEFVTDLYQAFLQREPDGGGLAYWAGQLKCLTRNMLITQFTYSQEFKQYMDNTFGPDTTRPENNLVNDFYRGLLNRFPDDGGFNGWLGAMREAQCAGAAAMTEVSHQIALAFVQSEEYAGRNRDNTEYIEDLYNGILRRGADCAGFNAWVDNLDSGMSREEVLDAFTDCPEFQSRVQAVIAAGCVQ
jgi:hypothetical protein